MNSLEVDKRPDDSGAEPPGLRDSKFRSRLGWAIAVSIAFHEIAAGLWPGSHAPAPQPTVVAERIVLERPPTPRPTPKPTPTPRPTPVPTPKVTPAPHYTFAPKIVVRAPAARSAATTTHRLGGAAAQKAPVKLPPRVTVKPVPPVALVDGTHAGQQNGGTGSGAGAGNGTGGQNGVGTGSGTAGTGTGGDSNSAPCGLVTILPIHVSFRRDGTSVQTVEVQIRLRDGLEETGAFPYPFIYPSERENPFLHDDRLSTDGGVFVQQPPPGSDIATMPPAIQAVLTHTDPQSGKTLFAECPKAAGVKKPS